MLTFCAGFTRHTGLESLFLSTARSKPSHCLNPRLRSRSPGLPCLPLSHNRLSNLSKPTITQLQVVCNASSSSRYYHRHKVNPDRQAPRGVIELSGAHPIFSRGASPATVFPSPKLPRAEALSNPRPSRPPPVIVSPALPLLSADPSQLFLLAQEVHPYLQAYRRGHTLCA